MHSFEAKFWKLLKNYIVNVIIALSQIQVLDINTWIFLKAQKVVKVLLKNAL